MRSIRVTIERNWTHIDYTNGHTSKGCNVWIYEESHDGSNRGTVVAEWHTESDDLQAIKRDVTRKLRAADITPMSPATRPWLSHPYSLTRWVNDHRSYVLPERATQGGILPVMRNLLTGVEFI